MLISISLWILIIVLFSLYLLSVQQKEPFPDVNEQRFHNWASSWEEEKRNNTLDSIDQELTKPVDN